jgi:hypothetical protein
MNRRRNVDHPHVPRADRLGHLLELAMFVAFLVVAAVAIVGAACGPFRVAGTD